MGKALGMTVVAEGVENTEQEAFLRTHACDEIQGYLFRRPVPPRQLADLLGSVPAVASPPLQPGLFTQSEAPVRRKKVDRLPLTTLKQEDRVGA
jgi:EAL domain